MIVFLEGVYEFKSPACVWVQVHGIGYEVQISLHTYSAIQHTKQGRLLTYMQVKEDGHALYGFSDEAERSLFLHLISVSGVGTNTARMMLSSMKPDELAKAIIHGNERELEKIKGIGAKSAKRLILELKDKLAKGFSPENNSSVVHNNTENDALYALVSLGIARAAALAAIQKVSKQHPEAGVEETIKLALKTL